MQVHIEVIVGDGCARRIATIDRSATMADEGIGLTLAEAKGILRELQDIVVGEQAGEIVTRSSSCQCCGATLPRKSSAELVYRTAFGKLRLTSPRLYSRCRCGVSCYGGESFNPLAMHLTERTHPELLVLQARLASTMSYARASSLLGEILPVGAAPGSSSIKAQVRKVGRSLARSVEERGEQFFDEQPLEFPDPPATAPAYALELDAAYVRAVSRRCDGRKSFGIIISRLVGPEGPHHWHAFVIDESVHALTRLNHFLHRSGIGRETPLAFITDGGEDVSIPTIMPWRPVQVILDWFHIAMRFEHVLRRVQGLRHRDAGCATQVQTLVESAKWRLWHGRPDGCLEQLRLVHRRCSGALRTRVKELHEYLRRNRYRLIDYGLRHRSGLPISTSLAESSVESVIGDRFKKNRKMRWTLQGANALLHIRVADLNGDLAEALRGRHWTRPKPANDDAWDDWDDDFMYA